VIIPLCLVSCLPTYCRNILPPASIQRAGRFRVRIPAGARDFIFYEAVQTDLAAHTPSYAMGTGAGREVDSSPAFRAEVKNERSYTFTPPMCLRGVDRDNCRPTFFCFF
jgi:hypothetical protein